MREPLRADMFTGPDCSRRLQPFCVGDKWSGMVLRCLDGGPCRFSELRVPLHRVTPKVLTETLRAMERDGFLTHAAYDENPPRAEYELTALGRSLLGPLDTTGARVREHLPEPAEARAAYDVVSGA